MFKVNITDTSTTRIVYTFDSVLNPPIITVKLRSSNKTRLTVTEINMLILIVQSLVQP